MFIDLRSALDTGRMQNQRGVIHKKVGPLLIKQINPGGERGRDRSHVANQNREGKGSDKKSPRRSGWVVTKIGVFSILY